MTLMHRSGLPTESGTSARRPRRTLARLLIRALVMVGALALLSGGVLLAIGFVSFSRSIATTEPQSIPRADGIVVLTGGSQRLTDALSLLANGHGRKLLISGVHERTGREEIARTAGSRRDLLECCVDLGKSARNTIGNAIETRRWVDSNGFRSLLVVTSNYHLPRTLGEFRHALDGVTLIGHPVVSESVDVTRIWSDMGSFRLVASEYLKYVVSRLRHSIEADPEQSRLPVLVGRQKPLGPWPIERAAPP
jgi:uncharacterized SAM-binding protein YcdF (DUF218 family)